MVRTHDAEPDRAGDRGNICGECGKPIPECNALALLKRAEVRADRAEAALSDSKAELERVYAEMKERRDDAVRADSAREQMRAALEELVNDITHEDHQPGDWSVQVCVRNAREALAAAPGKEGRDE